MGEAFRSSTAHADESIERVVVVAAIAFAAVINACEVAVGIVVPNAIQAGAIARSQFVAVWGVVQGGGAAGIVHA